MSKSQQSKVPALLIEQCGTGKDVLGIIGKRIRIVQESQINPIRAIFEGQSEPDLQVGAEGEVIHVDEEGCIWADFGDDERAAFQHVEGGDYRLHSIGNVNLDNEDYDTLYELAE